MSAVNLAAFYNLCAKSANPDISRIFCLASRLFENKGKFG